jgi:hypothetical protein
MRYLMEQGNYRVVARQLRVDKYDCRSWTFPEARLSQVLLHWGARTLHGIRPRLNRRRQRWRLIQHVQRKPRQLGRNSKRQRF